jgi:hypothetical protein
MRQGNDLEGVPFRGIVARGVTTSATYRGTFNRDGTGKDTFRVNIRVDSVIGPGELPLKDPFYPIPSGERFSGPALACILRIPNTTGAAGRDRSEMGGKVRGRTAY